MTWLDPAEGTSIVLPAQKDSRAIAAAVARDFLSSLQIVVIESIEELCTSVARFTAHLTRAKPPLLRAVEFLCMRNLEIDLETDEERPEMAQWE
jgi:hypothetical protein